MIGAEASTNTWKLSTSASRVSRRNLMTLSHVHCTRSDSSRLNYSVADISKMYRTWRLTKIKKPAGDEMSWDNRIVRVFIALRSDSTQLNSTQLVRWVELSRIVRVFIALWSNSTQLVRWVELNQIWRCEQGFGRRFDEQWQRWKLNTPRVEENRTPYSCPKLCQTLIDSRNSFTIGLSSKGVMKLSLKIPPHLKRVTTLPRETS